MPDVQRASPALQDAADAIARARAAWRKSQALEAISAARRYLDEADAVLGQASKTPETDP
jgi:hypothetical protein